MIQPKSNLAVAETLLKVINTKLQNTKTWEDLCKKSIWYECFDNCREQGFVIILWCRKEPLRIAFSENRNTDQIVVYVYRNTELGSNKPVQSEWNAKYFEYGDYSNAGKFIISKLREELI